MNGFQSNQLTLLEPEIGYHLMHLLQVRHLAPKLEVWKLGGLCLKGVPHCRQVTKGELEVSFIAKSIAR